VGAGRGGKDEWAKKDKLVAKELRIHRVANLEGGILDLNDAEGLPTREQ